MLEELGYGGTETRVWPFAAEPAREFGKARDEYRFIEGTAESAAGECGRRFLRRADRFGTRRQFSDRETTANSI